MQAGDIEAAELIRHAKDLRDTWQGRVLAAAREARNMLAVASMLAHAFDDAMGVMFRVVRPSCWDVANQSLRTPFLCSCAKVDKAGRVVADAIMFDGALPARDKVLYLSLRDFEGEMRRIADIARLNDEERKQFFIVAKNWIVADRRIDPNMDPADPDSRRLTVN